MLTDNELKIIQDVFGCERTQIKKIRALKRGMTNVSYLFEVNDDLFMIRTPGHGTEKLINRKQEWDVYQKIAGLDLAEQMVYLSYETGHKITKFFPEARVCDGSKKDEVQKSLSVLKAFHKQEIEVAHAFDLFEKIAFYESLYGQSEYEDYVTVRDNVFKLKSYLNTLNPKRVLTHIDANPDNFLIMENTHGTEKIRLIDWEYAAMQDPHVDIAMFCVYAGYEREQIDEVIEMYFEGACAREIQLKIYAYIAICGLLWSNWCEYKKSLGITFGDYATRQYRYAKAYYQVVKESGVLDE